MQASTIAPICFLIAAFCAYKGFQIPKEATSVEARRVPISLLDLRREQTNEFKEWKLHDFRFCNNYVTDADEGGFEVWIPIYPETNDVVAQSPDDRELREVLRAYVHNKDELNEILASNTLNVGVAGSSVFDEAALESLQLGDYPGLRPAQCRIITKLSGYFAYEDPAGMSSQAFIMSGLFLVVGLSVCGLEVYTRTRRVDIQAYAPATETHEVGV